MWKFNGSDYKKKSYKKWELFFIKWFDFQRDIPNKKWKQKNTFTWIRSLLTYLTEKAFKVYITNHELDRDYEMVWDWEFLVDISKFIWYCDIMSSKASPKLAQGFFTHDIDVKNAKFTEEQKVQIASDLSNNILVSAITAKPVEDKIEILQEVIDNLPIKEMKNLIIETSLKDLSTKSIMNEASKRKWKDKEEYIKSLCSSLSDDDFDEIIKQNMCWKDFVNVAYRKAILEIFKSHLDEEDWSEKEWQDFFDKNPWVFWYGLNYRYLKILQKEWQAKNPTYTKKGGAIGDFLCADDKFTVFVELKRPDTVLFGTEQNRGWAWRLSNELIDAYSQILEHKSSGQIKIESERDWPKQRAYDSKVILIIGNWKQIAVLEWTKEKQVNESRTKEKTLELFRRDSRNIEIITYDELLERAKFICSNDKIIPPKQQKKVTK